MQWRDAHKCRVVWLSRSPHRRPCACACRASLPSWSLLALSLRTVCPVPECVGAISCSSIAAGCREDRPADVRMLRFLHYGRGETHAAQLASTAGPHRLWHLYVRSSRRCTTSKRTSACRVGSRIAVRSCCTLQWPAWGLAASDEGLRHLLPFHLQQLRAGPCGATPQPLCVLCPDCTTA
jgi:hypothetical protein